MANFPSFTFTAAGSSAITRSLSGKDVDRLIITKCVLGDGVYSGDIETLKAVTSPKMTVTVSEYTDNGDGTSVTRFVYDNASLDVGFSHREMGIYAKNGDSGAELLLCYSNAGNQYSYIKAGTVDSVTKQRKATIPPQTFKFVLATGGSGSVNAVIDPKGYVDVEMLKEHNNDPTAHPDKLVNLTTNGNSLRAVKGDGTNVDVVVPYAVGTTTLKLQSNELTLDMGNGTQTNINIGLSPKNYSGSGFNYTFYNGKNSLADIVAKTISARVYGSYIYSPPVDLTGKTIADFRSTIQSAMASTSYQGGKTIVVFSGDFSGILSNWANTTFSIVAGPTFSVEISNIDSGSNYAHCKVYTYSNEEYHFYVSAGTWSSIDGNVLVSNLSQKVTTELATHNTDLSAHTPIINAHNADVNAHTAILNAIKAISGMSKYDIAPSKTIAAIITLLGFGGIVAQRLEPNGYVKFANGFTIQWGYDNVFNDDMTAYWREYNVAFETAPIVVASIAGNCSDSIVVSNVSNIGFERVSHENFNTNKRVTRPCYWAAFGK